MEKAYTIIRTSEPDWNVIPKAFIESYTWGGDYRPLSYAQLALVERDGNKCFAVRLTSYEKQPKAVYTKYNEPVYKDSCLEFFAAFNNESPLYMNFEANSNGAFLAAIRKERKNKTPLHELMSIDSISIKGVREEDKWFVEYYLPCDMLSEAFGVKDFQSGYSFKGNFYKCGDETAVPHFGSYYPIDLPQPDFHCPQFFGEFIIG